MCAEQCIGASQDEAVYNAAELLTAFNAKLCFVGGRPRFSALKDRSFEVSAEF